MTPRERAKEWAVALQKSNSLDSILDGSFVICTEFLTALSEIDALKAELAKLKETTKV